MNSTFICQTIYLFYRCSSTPINFHVIGVDKRIKCPGTRTYRTYPLWSMQDECLALVVRCGNIHIDVQIERILLVWLSVCLSISLEMSQSSLSLYSTGISLKS